MLKQFTRSQVRWLTSLVGVLILVTSVGFALRLQPKADSSIVVNLPCGTKPVVRITASNHSAFETGSQPDYINITRLGSTTGTLAVKFDLAGDATYNRTFAQSDYKIDPNGAWGPDNQPILGGSVTTPVQGSGQVTVTMPTGATRYQLLITPRNDITPEPTERITYGLREQPSYVIDQEYSSTFTDIYDNDSDLVSVIADDPTASEPGLRAGDTGLFTVSRSHVNISQPLLVNFTRTGTATADSDYTMAPVGVTIPAGQNSIGLVITALTDTATTEPTETVIFTVEPGPNYTPAPTKKVATVNIENAPTAPTPTPTPTPTTQPTNEPVVRARPPWLQRLTHRFLSIERVEAQQNNGIICGTLLDEQTSVPLPNMSVKLWRLFGHGVIAETTTNAQGYFEFSGLDRTVESVIWPQGNNVYPRHFSRNEWVYADAPPLGKRVEIRIQKGGFIHGKVTAGGTPIEAGTRVMIQQFYEGERFFVIYQTEATTDSQGNYLSPPLPHGYDYRLWLVDRDVERRDFQPAFPSPGTKVDIEVLSLAITDHKEWNPITSISVDSCNIASDCVYVKTVEALTKVADGRLSQLRSRMGIPANVRVDANLKLYPPNPSGMGVKIWKAGTTSGSPLVTGQTALVGANVGEFRTNDPSIPISSRPHIEAGDYYVENNGTSRLCLEFSYRVGNRTIKKYAEIQGVGTTLPQVVTVPSNANGVASWSAFPVRRDGYQLNVSTGTANRLGTTPC